MPNRGLLTELKILKNVKSAVSSLGHMMMFDSLLNTIIAGFIIVLCIIGIFKIIELATGRKINLFERFISGQDKKFEEQDKDSQPAKLE